MKKKKTPQPAWKSYSFWAMILAVLGLLSTLFLGVTQGLIAAQLYQVADPSQVDRWLFISIGAIFLGLALYAVLEPDKTSNFFTRRQTRYGSNSLVMIVAVLLILGFGNAIANDNPLKVADLTEDKENTLAPELLDALDNLPAKVEAIAFFTTQSNRSSAETLLSNIKANSNRKFDYRFENPDANPLLARQEGITGNGKILLKMGDRKEIAAYADEREILNAIIRLTNPTPRAVYFLTGHGEAGLDTGEDNFASAKETLENKNYTVKPLNLLTEGKIPEDALSIIIAGPKKPLSPNEVGALKAYVDRGGSLVIMQDPYQFTDIGDVADPLADYLAVDWGLTFNKDVILDTNNSLGLLYAVSAIRAAHPITQDIDRNLVIIMKEARSIGIAAHPEGVTLTALIQTTHPVSNSTFSWGEMEYVVSDEGRYGYDEGVDLLGPLNMAVAGENGVTGGRVVVMGNSRFAAGQNFDLYGNGNFFINSIDWAASQEDLIAFTPRQTTQRFFAPPTGFGQLMIFLSTICIIPGLIVGAGVYTWVARRRKG